MKFIECDGGRAAAGYRGFTGDCVARSIAIAANLPYSAIYDALAEGNQKQRKSKRSHRAAGERTARKGIQVHRQWFKDFMKRLGFVWYPVMGIGTGCKMHLQDDEVPMGRLVVSLSKHYTCVINGVVYDTYDPSREGTRCIYGYWKLENHV